MSKLSEYLDVLDATPKLGYQEWHVPLSALRSMLKPHEDPTAAAMLKRFKLGSGYDEFWYELQRRNWRVNYLQMAYVGAKESYVAISHYLAQPDGVLHIKLDRAKEDVSKLFARWKAEDSKLTPDVVTVLK